MHYIVGETVVSGPVEEVFDRVADVAPGTRFAERPGSVGAHLGRTVEYAAYQRPHLLTSMTALPGAILHDALRFEPAPGGTRVRWMCSVEPTGGMRLLGPIAGRLVERRARRAWEELTAALESREASVVRLAPMPSLS